MKTIRIWIPDEMPETDVVRNLSNLNEERKVVASKTSTICGMKSTRLLFDNGTCVDVICDAYMPNNKDLEFLQGLTAEKAKYFLQRMNSTACMDREWKTYDK